MSPRVASILLTIAALLLTAGAADARRSDRDQPMDIDAGRQEGSLDESTPTVLSGGVVITQGSLRVDAERAEVTLRGGEPLRVVLTGSPATMSQEMDSGERMTARANRIDHDLAEDIMVMTGDAVVERPQGTMRSQRIVYNMQTERVEAGGGEAGRVKLRLEPRSGRQDGGN